MKDYFTHNNLSQVNNTLFDTIPTEKVIIPIENDLTESDFETEHDRNIVNNDKYYFAIPAKSTIKAIMIGRYQVILVEFDDMPGKDFILCCNGYYGCCKLLEKQELFYDFDEEDIKAFLNSANSSRSIVHSGNTSGYNLYTKLCKNIIKNL